MALTPRRSPGPGVTSPPSSTCWPARGFLVWQLDNRGSAGRGKTFESGIHRRLGQLELEDHLTGVEHLRSLPYVDTTRMGITGGSYGGYLTLYALTNAPEVFRSGLAGAPVTDWRFYDTIYTERYMGTPEDNPEGYAASAPLTRAAALESDLLIIHGSSDDNVHLANTMAFVAELIKADRPHRLDRPPPAEARLPPPRGPHRPGPGEPGLLRADAEALARTVHQTSAATRRSPTMVRVGALPADGEAPGDALRAPSAPDQGAKNCSSATIDLLRMSP